MLAFSSTEDSDRQVGTTHPEQDVSCGPGIPASADLLFTTVNLSEGLVLGLCQTLMAL